MNTYMRKVSRTHLFFLIFLFCSCISDKKEGSDSTRKSFIDADNKKVRTNTPNTTIEKKDYYDNGNIKEFKCFFKNKDSLILKVSYDSSGKIKDYKGNFYYKFYYLNSNKNNYKVGDSLKAKVFFIEPPHFRGFVRYARLEKQIKGDSVYFAKQGKFRFAKKRDSNISTYTEHLSKPGSHYRVLRMCLIGMDEGPNKRKILKNDINLEINVKEN